MKTKIIFCLALVLVYAVLAYIFMWPPVVRNYYTHLYGNRVPWTGMPCVNTLYQIDAAVNEWARVNGKHAGDRVTLEDIKPYIKLDSHGKIPACPFGGKYSVTVVGAPPTCSLGTNQPCQRIRMNYFYYVDVGGDVQQPNQHMIPKSNYEEK